MKYLTLDYIKAHSRIDYDCEDDLIEQYGDAAEETILDLINCSYDDLVETYGKVPARIRQATFEIADHLIRHRAPAEQVSLSSVPYNFELMLKSFIVL